MQQKADLKDAVGVDTSNLVSKKVRKLKAEVDKLDIEKLKTIFFDLIKLAMLWVMKLSKICVW